MANMTLPDGTYTEGNQIIYECADGSRLTSTDGNVVNEFGNTVNIGITGQLLMELARIGKRFDDVLYATVLSPSGVQWLQIAINQVMELRSAEQVAELQGQIVERYS